MAPHKHSTSSSNTGQSPASASKGAEADVYNEPADKVAKTQKTIELEILREQRTDWVTERRGTLIAVDPWKRVGPPDPRHLVERKAVDDRLFTEIARLAEISASDLERFRQCVSYELDKAWIDFRHAFVPFDPAEVRIGLKQLQKLKAAWEELSEIISSLNNIALYPLRIVADERFNVRSTPDELKELLKKYMDEYAARVLFWLANLSQTPVRGVGRPPGGLFTRWTEPYARLVRNLLWDVHAFGGRLTLDKNTQEGSLLAALDALIPYLPPGFFPKPLPVSTLARIKVAARKLAGDEMENKSHSTHRTKN